MAIDYEVLQDVGQVSARRRLEEGILQTEMGDGYYRAALIGSLEGTYVWTLQWTAVHRDQPLIQRLSKNGASLGFVPRGRYLIEFYHYHMTQGCRSFHFTDFDRPVASRTQRLCHFTSPVFEMQQSSGNPLIYSYSVELRQSRGVQPQALLLEKEEDEDNAEPLSATAGSDLVP